MKKNTSRLIGVMIVLFFLSALLFSIRFISLSGQKKIAQPYAKLDEKNISEIIIEGIPAKVLLHKESNAWYIQENKTSYPADTEKIKKIIEAVKGFKKDEVVSTNTNKHKEFGIGNQTLSFVVNKKKNTLFIGNGYAFEKNYVRLNDEKEIYIAGGFQSILSESSYKELLLNLIGDENKVDSITIVYPDNQIQLKKNNNDWLVNNKKIDKNKAVFLLSDLKGLQATDMLIEDIDPAVKGNTIAIVINENRKERTVNLYQLDDDYYRVKISDNKYIYKISTSSIESLMKKEEDFL